MRLKNVLYFLALALFIISLSNTAHATTGMVVYSNASAARSVPQYRIWNGTDFGAGLSTGITTGTIAWLKVATAPTRYEAVMGSLDSSGDIIFAVYDGKRGNWSNVINVSRVGFANANRSSFDIAYENINGRALVIYTNGTLAANNASIYQIWNGTAAEAYNIWNGSSWLYATPGGSSLPTDGCTDVPEGVKKWLGTLNDPAIFAKNLEQKIIPDIKHKLFLNSWKVTFITSEFTEHDQRRVVKGLKSLL